MAEAFITRRGGGGGKFASGSKTFNNLTTKAWVSLEITGLGFKPKLVGFRFGDYVTGFACDVNGTIKSMATFGHQLWGASVGAPIDDSVLNNDGFTVRGYTDHQTSKILYWYAIG